MVAREGDTRRVKRSKSPEMKYISRSIDSANKSITGNYSGDVGGWNLGWPELRREKY